LHEAPQGSAVERTGREQEPHLYGSLGRQGTNLKPPPPKSEPNGERPPPTQPQSACVRE
jgi:hypothetical protein